MPQRIQRRRTKGYRLPANAVSITRPGRFGNPFKVGELNRDSGKIVTLEKSLEYFEFYLHRKYPGDALREFLAHLRGKDLACFCPEGLECHGDILLRLANA